MLKFPYPLETSELADVRAAIVKYILPGYVPAAPLLRRDADVMTLGSCFAETVNDALTKANIKSSHLKVSETINTPAYAHVMVQRLLGRDTSAIGHLGPRMMQEEALVQVRARLRGAAAFIFTVGVALQPFHEDGLPMFHFSKTHLASIKHGTYVGDMWRMLTVDEIAGYIRSIAGGLREFSPGVPVIVTLSPIPLMNSVSHPSVMGQDCISKSNIRAAIAAVMDENIPGIYYWPSFEVFRWLGGHVGPFFGVEGLDQRHVSPQVIDVVTSLFIEHFFHSG